MEDIHETLAEYRQSRRLVVGRIADINAEICQLNKEKQPLGNRIHRRYTLYSELVDLDAAIREMEKYLEIDDDTQCTEKIIA